jgi:hypothetical protein
MLARLWPTSSSTPKGVLDAEKLYPRRLLLVLGISHASMADLRMTVSRADCSVGWLTRMERSGTPRALPSRSRSARRSRLSATYKSDHELGCI